MPHLEILFHMAVSFIHKTVKLMFGNEEEKDYRRFIVIHGLISGFHDHRDYFLLTDLVSQPDIDFYLDYEVPEDKIYEELVFEFAENIAQRVIKHSCEPQVMSCWFENRLHDMGLYYYGETLEATCPSCGKQYDTGILLEDLRELSGDTVNVCGGSPSCTP